MWSAASAIFISSLQRLLTANVTLIPQRQAVPKASQDIRFSEAMVLLKDIWTLPPAEGACMLPGSNGGIVKEGQLLAQITAPELDHQIAQAEATLSQTEATLRQNQANEDLGTGRHRCMKRNVSREDGC